MSVSALFQRPEDAPDAEAALDWAKSYGDDSQKAIRECPRGDWLIWMLTRLKVAPSVAIEIGYECSLHEISRGFGLDFLMPIELSIVQNWLDGEATSEDFQMGLDGLSISDMVDLDGNKELVVAKEVTWYILNACIDIDEGLPRSDLAGDLAWTVYTVAKLQTMGNLAYLEDNLREYADFIREFLRERKVLDF